MKRPLRSPDRFLFVNRYRSIQKSTIKRGATWFGIIRRCMNLAALFVLTGSLSASNAPFVAGFDRFGRHGDIDVQAAGRLLLSELSCAACHSTADADLKPKQGPVLDAVGSRLQATWIRQFLNAPLQTKPGTTMPDALAGVPKEKKPAVLDALVAFLAARTAPFPEIKATGANPVPFEFWNKGDVEVGKSLYHQIGCVACHDADSDYEVVGVKPSSIDQLLDQLDPEEIKELGLTSAARRVESVPHSKLAVKYSHRSLTHFLLQPETIRAAGRMPSFNLTAMDAAHLAAYLMARKSNRAPKRTARSTPSRSSRAADRLVSEGRQLFTELGCANCHSIRGMSSGHAAKPLSGLNAESADSCYAKLDTKHGQPSFRLDDVQQQAIKAALADLASRQGAPTADPLQFQMLKLNCYACHERDKRGGVGRFRKPYFETVGHVDIGDEGRLPPKLTNVGRKLQPAFLTNVLAGKVHVRPHMHVRMPRFPSAVVKPLPSLLMRADGGTQQPSVRQVFGKAAGTSTAESGRLLMDAGCVQCHSFKGETLPGTVGIDLQGISQRLYPKWFHDFLLDPGSLSAGTRMPTFFPGGVSQNKDILAGNTEQQIAAMWAYLRDLDRQPLPAKIVDARAKDYELSPKEHPIVLRTFMPHAGTHAIAVGFPQKVHYAFDAETISLAVAWRGKFIDAEGTWFVRFAPPAAPLGDHIVRFPPGVLLAAFDSAKSPWPVDADSAHAKFSGYRLDKSATPTLQYSVSDFVVEDHIAPGPDQTLKRRLVIRPRRSGKESPVIWMRAHAGVSLTRNSSTSVTSKRGLQVFVRGDSVPPGQIRTSNGGNEWILRLDVDDQRTIEVDYEW